MMVPARWVVIRVIWKQGFLILLVGLLLGIGCSSEPKKEVKAEPLADGEPLSYHVKSLESEEPEVRAWSLGAILRSKDCWPEGLPRVREYLQRYRQAKVQVPDGELVWIVDALEHQEFMPTQQDQRGQRAERSVEDRKQLLPLAAEAAMITLEAINQKGAELDGLFIFALMGTIAESDISAELGTPLAVSALWANYPALPPDGAKILKRVDEPILRRELLKLLANENMHKRITGVKLMGEYCPDLIAAKPLLDEMKLSYDRYESILAQEALKQMKDFENKTKAKER